MLGVEVHRDATAGGGGQRVLLDAVAVLRAVRRLGVGGKPPLGMVGMVRFHDGGPDLLLHRRGEPARLPVADALAGRVVEAAPHAVACAHRAGLVAAVRAPVARLDVLRLPPAVLLEGLDVLVPRLVLGRDLGHRNAWRSNVGLPFSTCHVV